MKRLLFAFLAFTLVTCEHTCSSKDCKKVLFIGNSFSYENDGVNEHLKNLISGTNNLDVYVESATEGRYHLMTHWKDSETQSLFDSEKWDKIVLQEYALGPLKKNAEFEKYTKKWTRHLRSKNPKGEVFLFSTWSYRKSQGMGDRVYAKYTKIADEVDAEVVPVGMLWKAVRSQINLYMEDGAHPNRMGTFLSACLFYERLFNLDVTQTKHTDPIISKSEQARLKHWAHAFNSNWQE